MTWREEDRGHTTPCWIWEGLLDGEGYGQTTNRRASAHRWVYERLVGRIPVGLELDHLCRVRCCVNPDHLEPVTHQENCRRAADARLPVCVKHGTPRDYTETTTGYRRCRKCMAERQQRYRAKKRRKVL